MVVATAVLLVLYAGIVLFLVVRGAKTTKSMTDYAVGSMQFSPLVVGLSLAAAITSAATFVINPGFVAKYGFSAYLAYGIATPVGLFLSLIFLTKQFRLHGTATRATTMAQWIGTRYENRFFGFFFALLSLLLITFIVLICVGLTKMISQALNAGECYVLAGTVVFVFGYMMFGGANAMVYTNTIQAILMLVVAVILIGSGYAHFSGGVSGFLSKLSDIDPQLTAGTYPASPLFRDYFEIIFCSFVVGIAIVCQPHIITKSLILKSDSAVNRYLWTGILAEALFFTVVFAGFHARLMFPDLTFQGKPLPMDGIIPAYVVSAFPVSVGILVVLGILSAGFSTLEGLIQSLSTTITADILVPFAGDRLPKDRQVVVNRVVIVLLGLVSFALSWQQLQHPSLSVAIFAQNGVYAYFSAAFVPVLLGIFFRGVPTIAPLTASLAAVAVHFGVYYSDVSAYMAGSAVRNPAIAATYALLVSSAVGFGLYFLFRKKQVQP